MKMQSESLSMQLSQRACIDEEYECDGPNQCNDRSDESPQKCIKPDEKT